MEDSFVQDNLKKEEESQSANETKLCPSKSTVYVGNISYSLTNNDLMTVFEKCGKIVSAKIAKDQVTRRSKGYGFVQFLKEEDAIKCVEEYNGIQIFGRKWTCSIAKDNGRTPEFIRKRTYPDKTRCYECGEFGHLSYKCPKNALGSREPPRKRKGKRKSTKNSSRNSTEDKQGTSDNESSADDDKHKANDPKIDSLGAAINYQREKVEDQIYREIVASGIYPPGEEELPPKRRKFVKDGYFSDEETLTDCKTDS